MTPETCEGPPRRERTTERVAGSDGVVDRHGRHRHHDPLASGTHPHRIATGGVQHHARTGAEQQIDPGIAQHARVDLLLARVFRQVLVRPELFRVDEDRHDHAVAGELGLGHERHVPGMQRAHRRNECDSLSGRTISRNGITEFGKLTDGLHANEALDMDGKRGLLWGGGPGINQGS